MDAATLRLILIVVGAAFLVGLYLWERRRAEDRDDDHDWDNYLGTKREPNLGPLESHEREFAPDDEDRWQSRSEFESSYQPEYEPEFASDAEPESPSEERDRTAAAGGGEADAFEDEPAAPSGATALQADRSADGQEMLLIQLFVVAVGEPFAGERVLAAAGRVKLVPGSMDIFHRLADDSVHTPLFSMANMVKPGAFPFDAMDEFETPGLALFAQLTGASSDLMVYDELLHAARTLAQDLGGDVQERGRRTLTAERAGILRGQVSALFQRQPGHPAGE